MSYEYSFNGKIDEIENISVDNFDNTIKMAYFLSHMHFDHNKGLYNKVKLTALENNYGIIYMSEESFTILSINNIFYKNREKLKRIIEPLRTGFTYTIDLSNQETIKVTLIPVRHMVGAVMFLFQTIDKNILFTGDFVIDTNEVSGLEKLHNKDKKVITIDTMYVDSTYNSPKYEFFPSQESAIKELTDKAEDLLKNNDHQLALYPFFEYGYEDLYRALYERCNMKILVEENMYNVFEALYGKKNFATAKHDGKSRIQVHVKSKSRFNAYQVSKPGIKYHHVRIWGIESSKHQPALRNVDNTPWHFCFSIHCSKSQLDNFKKYINPKKIVPFPIKPKD